MNKRIKTTCVTASPVSGSPKDLSRAEKRTLMFVIAGLSTSDIAELLNRSPETIKSHRESLLRKLGAENIAHAIALAYERGIVETGTLARVQQVIAARSSRVAA